MDYLMKLVTTALEWSYQAGEIDVRAEALEKTAELLVLRRDTFRIIDGDGPSVNERDNSPENPTQTLPEEHAETEDHQALTAEPEPATGGGDAVESRKQSAKTPKCTFSGMMVPIDLKRFQESGVTLVECPDCACTRTLEPHGGILRFKSHHKRKTTAPNTEPRWAREKTDWDVVGEERKR